MQKLFALLPIAFMAIGCSETKTTKDINTSVHIETKPKKIKNHFTQDKSKKAFSKPVKGLSREEEHTFTLGKSFFSVPWVTSPASTTSRDGLGPLFSANTCIHCHPRNGAGVALTQEGKMTRSYLIRLSHAKSNDTKTLRTVGFKPDSTYGAQLSRNGNRNVPAEGQSIVKYTDVNGTYPDGTTYTLRKPHYTVVNLGYGKLDKETIIAGRIGSALVGLGHLEDIAQKDILAYEDVNDSNGDGISGKANYAFDPETNTTKLGRFTWKASAVSVKHQSAAAAHNDMGLSTPLFPKHNCTEKQVECLQNITASGFAHDLPKHRLDAITYYLSNLAVPKQREPKKHQEGAKIFESLNCTSCHVPAFKTVSGIDIKPYTDLLLHDMGEGLADGRSEFLASGVEWRTAPLWGKGLHEKVSGEANYLHDGRARSLEEAILWHGGEAEKSKKEFMALDKKSRQKVLKFINSI